MIQPLTLRVLRSSQVDASQLDDELLRLFEGRLHGCLAVFHAAWSTGRSRELLLVLESIIFGLTVARGRPSPGMSLLNLTYRDERRSSVYENGGSPLTKGQRMLLYLGNILLPYAWAKVASGLVRCMDDGMRGDALHALSVLSGSGSTSTKSVQPSLVRTCRLALRSSASRLWSAMQSVEAAWKMVEVMNYALFIRYGTYRGALERLIDARLVYGDVGASRHISFDYLNRQLIWSEVSDFVLFVLPLVHAGSIGRFVNKYLPMNESMRGSSTVRAEAMCPICGTTKESPVRCQAVPCKHVYCYYCIASRMGASTEPRCYVCSERIQHVEMVM